LLIKAVFAVNYPLRLAQTQAPATLLTRLFRRHDVVPSTMALPATDGNAIWLPNSLDSTDWTQALARFRTLALLQALRAFRGSTHTLARATSPLNPRTYALYLILEAQACDHDLVQRLP